MKTEFDESTGQTTQGMGPNIKGSLTAAIAAAAVPVVEVAKSLHASSISSMPANVVPLPSMKEQPDKINDIQIQNANEIESTIRKMSAQMSAPMGLLAADPCIDGEEGVDVDQEEFTPHFQRVSVSGDDNTGVSY